MNRSETIGKLASALVKAQAQMGVAIKDSANPFFKSKYADLTEVIDTVKKPLNDNGICFLQILTVDNEGRALVETTLLHESGEFISGNTLVIVAKQNDPQAQGSGITYAKRYGLQAICGLPTDDDDGEGAMARPTQSKSSLLDEVRKFTKGKDQATVNKMILFAGGDSTDTIETLTTVQLEKIVKHIRR